MKTDGLTPQREAFAVALASGKSQAEAYRIAYPKSVGWKPETVWRKASLLAKDGEVQARVQAVRAPAVEAAGCTLQQHLRRLEELGQAAQDAGQHAAAIRAEELRGKVSGHYSERVELSGPGGGPVQSVALTPDQFRAVALEMAGRI
jgi:hypothetical protein